MADQHAIEPQQQPHEPTERERATRDRVRDEAAGMSHHEAAAAREAAEEALAAGTGAGAGADEEALAAAAEWQRITELLADHSGPYAPESDPFVQGQLTARENLHAVRAPGPPPASTARRRPTSAAAAGSTGSPPCNLAAMEARTVRTLLLNPPRTSTAELLAQAAAWRGYEVLAHAGRAEGRETHWYGGPLAADALAGRLGLGLLEPADEWLATVPHPFSGVPCGSRRSPKPAHCRNVPS